MAEIILVAKRHLVSAHNLIACRYNWRATACWRMIRVRLSRQRVWSGRRDLNRGPLAYEAWSLPLSFVPPCFFFLYDRYKSYAAAYFKSRQDGRNLCRESGRRGSPYLSNRCGRAPVALPLQRVPDGEDCLRPV